MPIQERTLRVTVGPQPLLVVLVGVAGAIAAFGLLTSAHRQLGWVLACAVAAAMLEPLVELVGRYVPRVVAILVAVGLTGAVVGGVVAGVLSDMDNQYARIQREAPRAAQELEDSDALGGLASDFRLRERVDEVLAEVQKPTSGLGNEAASAGGTYFLCAILTCFFLAWGPRVADAALRQVGDPHRRALLRAIAEDAFVSGRTWLLCAVGRAVLVGGVMFAVCRFQEIPGPVVLAVVAAACTPVPGFGVLLGTVPALLLAAGLGEGREVAWMLIGFTVLQLVDLAFLRRVVTPRTLNVGPAAVVVAAVVGFEVYGLGGAVYGAALAVMAVAVLDAASRRDLTIVDAVPELVEDGSEAPASI